MSEPPGLPDDGAGVFGSFWFCFPTNWQETIVATLIFEDPQSGQEVTVDIGPELPEVTIGRKPGNVVRVNQPSVSREHAIIVWEEGECTIQDRDSSNGTYVNGSRIQSQVLRPGDNIQVGDFPLQFEASEQAEKGGAPPPVRDGGEQPDVSAGDGPVRSGPTGGAGGQQGDAPPPVQGGGGGGSVGGGAEPVAEAAESEPGTRQGVGGPDSNPGQQGGQQQPSVQAGGGQQTGGQQAAQAEEDWAVEDEPDEGDFGGDLDDEIFEDDIISEADIEQVEEPDDAPQAGGNEQVAELKAENERLQNRVAELEEQLDSSPDGSEVDALETQLDELEQENDRLEEKLADREQELDDLEAELAELEDLKDERDELERELDDAEQQVERLEVELESAEDGEGDAADAKIEELEQQVEELKEERRQRKEAFDDLSQDLKSLAKKNKKLKKERDELREELADA